MADLYIGVMSGTSLDGIDIVLCEIEDDNFKLINSKEYPFDNSLKTDILSAINGSTTLKQIGKIDTHLGQIYANSINIFLSEFNINKDSVRAIGLHGQTLWHEPNSKYPFSMQLGNASLVNILTGLSVVSDFRQKDISLGGQGAPFAPAFHKYIFSRLNKKTAVLNIGGMANISILSDKLIGYDTGCGNVLLDIWTKQNIDKTYDKNGEWAKTGKVQNELLQDFLNEPYFSLNAPKSTGRELFNQAWLDKCLKKYSDLKAEDVQATLVELTALSIVNEVKKMDTELLIVCGGGLKNEYLMKRLKNVLDIKISSSNEYGVSGDFMEAMAFAWLTYKRIHKQKVELSSVTGAKEDTILGAIYE